VAKLNMVQAINLALHQEMAQDKSVLVLGQDIGVDGGVFRLTEGLLDEFGKERVIDTPLAESAIIGTSIGMAMAGLKPVCEMQFSGFSYLMMGQFEAHATRMRARTHGQFTVPMVIRMPFGGGVRALEHHSESRPCCWRRSATLIRWSSWSRNTRTAPSVKRCRRPKKSYPSARRRSCRKVRI